MTDQKQELADRNQERSEEAHWQVAEAGAEEEQRLSTRKAGQGDEVPVPKSGSLEKVSEPKSK